MQMLLYPHIIADSDILAGIPVIEGTQIAASALVEAVAAGKSIDWVAQDSGVSAEDVRAALEYAAQLAGQPVATMSYVAARVPDDDPEMIAAAEKEAQALGLDPATLSPLGRRLLTLRAEIVASGTPLLSVEEFDVEMAEMRGDPWEEQAE